ncbi:Metal resistance protein YCF1-like protein 2 [Botryosphaeria dothidea]|uniref:Metal resistance protein YCF1-like protein 2 n=1 Tax=Botryosphaeria dothidea TaxID=55169 RepID=A0A8H4NE46_9PEZI|nr:Metal resistance protein YCF1-like protein 2 [Botryosphaeria dothidea]
MSQPNQSCPVSVDDSFGPWAGSACRGGFDFTLLFEESILSIPLSCLFLLLLPSRTLHLVKSDVKILSTPLPLLKLSAAVTLLCLNTALVGLWATTSSSTITHSRASVPAAVLTFVVSLGFCLLSWLEHARSIRPSFILNVYLFLSIVLDTARARTLYMLGPHRTIPALFTCTMVIRAIMLVLESVEKRRILLPAHKDRSRDATSGPINRSVFFWLTSLFLHGYRNILGLHDLYPMDKKLKSERLYKSFEEAWQRVPDKTVPGALFNTWLGACSGPVMSAAIPKLCYIGFTYAQPFLITQAIALASTPEIQRYDNLGYGLIGAYVIVYTGIAISTGQYEWRIYRAASMMRGAIVPCIYNKTLRLDSSAVSSADALTLISTDIDTIVQGIVQLHETWGGLVEIGIAVYLIYRQLGAACAMPVAFSIAVMVGTIFLAIPTGTRQAAWIQASQERVAATSKTLGNMKWLKISGLNDAAFSIIRKLRTREMEISRRFRLLLGVSVLFSICTPIWGPILTFFTFAGIAAGGSSTLTISKAFTSLSLLVLLNKPLANIIIALPTIAGAMASFQRIQDYLNARERDDKRLTGNPGENCALPTQKSGRSTSEAPILENGSRGDEHELNELRKDSTSTLGEDIIASVQGSFAWNDDSEPVIDISEWNIRRRTFTLVLGPVGCGKSTLLKSLLGELSAFQGTIRTNYLGVAYSEQTPWLPNKTVRDVIVGHADFDDSWYQKVIKACALEHDMLSWPKGDETTVGTKGISMSGGQKQRLSIARAVYARKEFMIFDDVFSGLDAATEELVFDSLLGETGMLRHARTTVVVASSDVRRAPYADYIVLLNDKGQIVEAGTSAELSHVFGFSEKQQATERKVETARAPDAGAGTLDQVLASTEENLKSARQMGDSAVYKFYMKSAGNLTLIIFFIAMAVFAFCDSFPSIWLKWWAEANAREPNADLGKWLGVYAALGVGAVAAVFVGTWALFIVVINRSAVYFHGMLIDTVSRAPMSLHATVDSGVTVNRFSQDLALIDMELPSAALGVTTALSFGIAQCILIAVSSKYMAIVLPFLVLLFYAIQHFYLRTSRQMRLLDIEYKAPLYSQLIETLNGLPTIRAFHWEEESEKNNFSILDDSQRPSYLLYCLQRWLTFAVDMIIALLALILIVITTTIREQIGPGYMGIALSNILAFSATMKATITSWVSLEVSLGAVARIKNFVSEVTPEDDSEGNVPETLDRDWPTQGAIELRDVSASYASSGRVLKSISMSIQPGQKIGICGRTGSGKSSLTLCLFRMIDQDGGSIAIDGIDISTLPHEFVRSRLVSVPQEPYIFDGSVRFNADPSESLSDDEITAALQKVKLWDKVEQRGGLDAVIDDNFFSQGQSQLLMCARAMLRKSKVVVLDEATSSLDNETSAIIDDVVQTWFQDRTVISIAHKLNSIMEFDKVAVLDSGDLVEFDHPRALLSRDSVFRELYDRSPHKRNTDS